MRTLYYSPGACSLAAHIVLEEIGAPFALHRVSIREGENLLPEYLAVNPRGRVPTLVEDRRTVTESLAILSWLGHSHPEAQVLDVANVDNLGRTLSLLSFFASSVHLEFAKIWRPGRFAEGEEAQGAVQASGRVGAERYLGEIETLAASRSWLVADRFSIADPYLLVFYRWGGLIGIDMSAYPNWTRHKERMLERPSVARALAAEGVEIA